MSTETEQKLHAEADFVRQLEAYILNPQKQFMFGGVHNLLMTIGGLCSELSQIEDDDWEKAAQLIEECASACDLKYKNATEEA